MIRPDVSILKAMVSLIPNEAWQRVVIWLKTEMNERRNAGDVLDGNDLYRNQGQCRFLNEFLSEIDKARDSLDKETERLARSQRA